MLSSWKLRCMSDCRGVLLQLSLIGVVSCVLSYIFISAHYKMDNRSSDHEKYGWSNISLQDFPEENGVTSDEDLTKKIRIMCLILTQPKSHASRAIHVKNTWGKRCNKLIFMSTVNDTKLGAIDVGVPEGREYLWAKTKAAFQHVYDNHLQEYDWFYKADDDTYAIMENLRYMLTSYSPEKSVYFGSRLKSKEEIKFMSGGAGYVLSRKATKKFVEEAMPNQTLCSQSPIGREDVEIGKCLANVGVEEGDSRDAQGRGRFFPLDLKSHLHGRIPKWYKDLAIHRFSGLSCCSDTAISFHYIRPDQMYEFEFLLYHVRPFGLRIETSV